MKTTGREQVKRFLDVFKATASKEGIYFVPRIEHRDALLNLGLTESDREEIILNLSVNDYCEGPDSDSDHEGDVWVFGEKINKKVIYIKLRFFKVEDKLAAKCLSFHEAKYRMIWPFNK